jgi:hypothetical protein
LAQDRDMWWALVNTIMSLQVIQKQGISWLAEWLLVLKKASVPWSLLVHWYLDTSLIFMFIYCTYSANVLFGHEEAGGWVTATGLCWLALHHVCHWNYESVLRLIHIIG